MVLKSSVTVTAEVTRQRNVIATVMTGDQWAPSIHAHAEHTATGAEIGLEVCSEMQ
jgi:hypothetical protein